MLRISLCRRCLMLDVGQSRQANRVHLPDHGAILETVALDEVFVREGMSESK